MCIVPHETNSQGSKLQLRNLDLSGKRLRATEMKKWQKNDIALPMSPILQPSSLELSDSSLYAPDIDDKLILEYNGTKAPKRRSFHGTQRSGPWQPRVVNSREKTPLVCSPSNLNISHLSTEAIFPKDRLFPRTVKPRENKKQFEGPRRAPTALPPPVTSQDVPLGDVRMGGIEDLGPPSKKPKQDSNSLQVCVLCPRTYVHLWVLARFWHCGVLPLRTYVRIYWYVRIYNQ